ncbi:MAG: hypothetical protein CSA62_14705 [Planctomycetota bacterium]|nr:MAG: hypothetical protein CSA62_14705 [Planctomycetota bacterium]
MESEVETTGMVVRGMHRSHVAPKNCYRPLDTGQHAFWSNAAVLTPPTEDYPLNEPRGEFLRIEALQRRLVGT